MQGSTVFYALLSFHHAPEFFGVDIRAKQFMLQYVAEVLVIPACPYNLCRSSLNLLLSPLKKKRGQWFRIRKICRRNYCSSSIIGSTCFFSSVSLMARLLPSLLAITSIGYSDPGYNGVVSSKYYNCFFWDMSESMSSSAVGKLLGCLHECILDECVLGLQMKS